MFLICSYIVKLDLEARIVFVLFSFFFLAKSYVQQFCKFYGSEDSFLDIINWSEGIG